MLLYKNALLRRELPLKDAEIDKDCSIYVCIETFVPDN